VIKFFGNSGMAARFDLMGWWKFLVGWNFVDERGAWETWRPAGVPPPGWAGRNHLPGSRLEVIL